MRSFCSCFCSWYNCDKQWTSPTLNLIGRFTLGVSPSRLSCKQAYLQRTSASDNPVGSAPRCSLSAPFPYYSQNHSPQRNIFVCHWVIVMTACINIKFCLGTKTVVNVAFRWHNTILSEHALSQLPCAFGNHSKATHHQFITIYRLLGVSPCELSCKQV